MSGHQTPEREDHATIISATEASQGEKKKGVRYVLGWSLLLVIIAFCLIYLIMRH